MSNKRIILGMSGGVDSSVCAYLLKKDGYEVIGLFMQNWDDVTNSDVLGHKNDHAEQCNAQKDFNDAKAVADKLGIEIHRTQFIDEYWNNVFKYMVDEYKKGRTPNPDILCNKFIKFKEFIDYAKKEFNCNQIAMGHYANTKVKLGKKYLTMAKDADKDQTYFLCWLNQEQLDSCIFPIGKYTKEQVREIAKEQGLATWDRKNSTGVCFIGERKFKEFLKNYITPKTGIVADAVTGKDVGTHEGIMYYTYGQNRNLNLGGNPTKYFVCGKNIERNILYVVDDLNKKKFLTSNKCSIDEMNWINGKMPKNKNVKIRFRHRQKLISGKIVETHDGLFLKYKSAMSVTPGQFAVLYQGKYCLGGGIVNEIIKD